MQDGPNVATELMVAYAYDTIQRINPMAFFGMVYVLEGTSIQAWSGPEALLDAAMPKKKKQDANGDASREQMQRLAARIAINRTVAGLHYPVDSAVGRLLGTALGEFLVARATGGRLHMKDKLAASRDIQTRAKVPTVIARRDLRIVRDRQSR